MPVSTVASSLFFPSFDRRLNGKKKEPLTGWSAPQFFLAEVDASFCLSLDDGPDTVGGGILLVFLVGSHRERVSDVDSERTSLDRIRNHVQTVSLNKFVRGLIPHL